MGDANTRWIAPYVLAATYRVDRTPLTTVRWFDDSGRVVKELSGPNLDPRAECIFDHATNGTTVYDVNGKWKLVVPQKPGPAGYITGSGDTFVHDFHPVEGQVAVDIYFQGRLVGTAGPFVQYFKASDVQLAGDGSMALLTWKTPEKQTAQAVVIGPDGKVRFQADCPPGAVPSYTCLPFGGGRGVLLRLEGLPEPPVRFSFTVAGGTWITRDIGTNAWPMECVLPGDLALFDLSIGEEESFQLFNCASGKAVWEIASPVQHWSGSISGAVALDQMLLFVGRDFAAVDMKTGELIARWKPNVPRRDRGWFAKRGTQLFFVTEDRFAELVPADIRAKRNGWQ